MQQHVVAVVVMALFAITATAQITPGPTILNLPYQGTFGLALTRNTSVVVLSSASSVYTINAMGPTMSILAQAYTSGGDTKCMFAHPDQFHIYVVTQAFSNFSIPFDIQEWTVGYQGELVSQRFVEITLDDYEFVCAPGFQPKSDSGGPDPFPSIQYGIVIASRPASYWFPVDGPGAMNLSRLGDLSGFSAAIERVTLRANRISVGSAGILLTTDSPPASPSPIVEYNLPNVASPVATRNLASDEQQGPAIEILPTYSSTTPGFPAALVSTLQNKAGLRVSRFDLVSLATTSPSFVDKNTTRGDYPLKVLTVFGIGCLYTIGTHVLSTQAAPMAVITQYYIKNDDVTATPTLVDQQILKLQSDSGNPAGILAATLSWNSMLFLADQKHLYRYKVSCPNRYMHD